MHLTQLATYAGPVVAVVGAISGLLWKRYRKSAGKELQPFRSYVGGSIRLAATRRVRPKLAARIAVRTYADVALAGFTRQMQIPSRGRSTLDIERAYIRLSLSSSPERRVDDETLLTAKGAVLIFGEPGSGKSSLTHKLHREALKQAYLRPMRSRLPLHFELGKLRWDDLPEALEARIEWLRALLRGQVARVKRVNEPDYVVSAFAEGPGLFITFDGLDEVPSDRIAAAQSLLAAAVEAFRHESPETLVVVTARTQMRTALARAFVDGFGEVLTVTPFTPADVFTFLRRWEFPTEKRFVEVHRIFDHLRNNATLSQMCTNPLVLAMYVAEDELHTRSVGSSVRLADTRAKFYDQVVGEFLYFRREDQRGQQAGTRLLITRQELLGRIALDHLLHSEDPANVVSLSRATRIAQRHWELDDPDRAERRLEELAVESGLVTVQVQGESLQFIHLSIAEYLAGKELAERSESELREVLKSLAADEPGAGRLGEMAVFAVALSNREAREQSLRQLADADAPTDLTLRIVRELQAYDLPLFGELVEAASAEIGGRPVSGWNTEWLARVRLVLSSLGDAQRLADVRRPASALTAAGWLDRLVHGNKDRFERIFSLYLTANPAEALRVAGELGVHERLLAGRERIVLAMEHPDVVAFALRMIADDPDPADDWIGVLAEAALRFELVAQILVEEPVPPRLMARAEIVDRRHAWHRIGPVAGTFFGALLAVATARIGTDWQDRIRTVGQLDLVALMPARSRNAPFSHRPFRKLMIGFWAFLVPAVVFLGATTESGWRPWSVSVVILAIGLMATDMARTSSRAFLRRAGGSDAIRLLLNIDPDPVGASGPLRIYLTKLSDGVYRIFVDEEMRVRRKVLRGARSATMQRDGLTVFDHRKRPFRIDRREITDLSRFTVPAQICTVSRRRGRKRCIRLDDERSVADLG